MSEVTPLLPDELYRRCDPKKLGFKTTDDLERLDEPIGQERAVAAIQFAMGIRHHGYNLFVIGPTGMGKHRFVRRFLENQANQEPVPSDWCYINNFDDLDKPKALRLPTGFARKLQTAVEKLVEELKVALPASFEGDDYQRRKRAVAAEFEERKEAVFTRAQEHAEERGLAFARTQFGMRFLPVVEGEVMSPDAFDELDVKDREVYEDKIEAMEEMLKEELQQRPQWERERRESLRELNREVTAAATTVLVGPMREEFSELPEVLTYLDGVAEDVVDNVEEFLESFDRSADKDSEPKDEPEASLRVAMKDSDNLIHRYGINIMVDGADAAGAPIVFEDNPTPGNLIGRLEYRTEMGALSTDVSLIRPGALHRANGGYLILEARKLLQNMSVWEALKRALRSNEIQVECPDQSSGAIHTVSLEPEPIPLETQVALLAEPWLYYNLAASDPDIEDLFKVTAEFEDDMDRCDLPVDYARLLATLVRSDKLRPFESSAIARIIEHSSRLVEDAEKLSTHMDSVVSLLRESEYVAGVAKRKKVRAKDVQTAIDAKIMRAGRLRDRMRETIIRGTILIDTDGVEIGQINGLSVLQVGRFSFGRPTRITAQIRLGKGDVLDIEREVELGGPIHSKGVLILTGFLGARFAQNHPLALSAALVFEQSYGGVDGDSASMAELCALLSAIAQVPIRQSYAVTGSVNQRGEVQAVAGVNDKIEGYFDICKERGLTGDQAVIIPRSTTTMLMLRRDVVEAVENSAFAVYAVDTVDQALELLTGLPAGVVDENGIFPEGTVNRLVADRLADLAELAKGFYRG